MLQIHLGTINTCKQGLGIEETVELVKASLPGKGKEDYFVSKFGRLLLFHEDELKINT